MNVLVLGATSSIGSEVAAAFAEGSNLLLAGRNPERLATARRLCTSRGAAQVSELVSDLADNPDHLIRTASEFDADVVINAASATSRLRDGQLCLDDFARYVMADLMTPIRLTESLAARRQTRRLGIIMISSALAAVPTPDRAFYGNLKRLQETALLRVAGSYPAVRLLIARICKRIPPDQPSCDALRFGNSVRAAYDAGRNRMSFGVGGQLMLGMYYLQPLSFALALRLARTFRGHRLRERASLRAIGRIAADGRKS